MTSTVLAARPGRSWNHHQTRGTVEYEHRHGASPLDIAGADRGERPPKTFLPTTDSNSRELMRASDAEPATYLVWLLVLTLTAAVVSVDGVRTWG